MELFIGGLICLGFQAGFGFLFFAWGRGWLRSPIARDNTPGDIYGGE